MPLFVFANVSKAMYALVINGEGAQEIGELFVEIASEEKIQVCLDGLDVGNNDSIQKQFD